MAQQQNPLVLKLMKFLPTLEIIFLAAVFIAVILKRYGFEAGDMLLMLAMQALAGVFFLSAFSPLPIPNDNEPMGFKQLFAYTIAPKVLGIASAVTTVGILFYLLKMEGAKQLLFIGSSSLGAGSLLLGFLIVGGLKHVNVVMPFLYRSVPLFLIGVYIQTQA
jgi:hypothetical protein